MEGLPPAKQVARPLIGVSLLCALLLAGASNSSAHEEWFRGLDLEPALSEASLVMVARAADVNKTTIMVGGKAETALFQFTFTPLQVLKGVFSGESLPLTSRDLGVQGYTGVATLEPGTQSSVLLPVSSRRSKIQIRTRRFKCAEGGSSRPPRG